MHRRAAVRQAVMAALAAVPGVTLTASRVFPLEGADLPSVNVLTGAEDADPEVDAIGADYVNQVRILVMDVEIRASAPSEAVVDDTLDAVALDVEGAVAADAGILALVDVWRYQGAGDVELTDELEIAVALRTLTYLATYRVNTTDPQ